MRAILTFHSIDRSGSILSFAPEALERLLVGLERSKVPLLDLDTLLDPATKLGVALSFDDGLRSIHSAALPILRAHRAPAHLFLTTGYVGGANCWPSQPSHAPVFPMLQWSEVEDLHGVGVRIEGHTRSHPDLCRLAEAAALEECAAADSLIEQRLGRAPRYFAFPYGRHNRRLRLLLGARYRALLTTRLQPLRESGDLTALPRLDSYYLRPSWLQRRPCGLLARGYLALRGSLRVLRHR